MQIFVGDGEGDVELNEIQAGRALDILLLQIKVELRYLLSAHPRE